MGKAIGTELRKAAAGDVAGAWRVIGDAKRLMADSGRDQWTEAYPALCDIERDVASGHAWVACDAGGEVAAYAMVDPRPEPAYAAIHGRWLTDGAYVTVHRLAVADRWRGRGLARALMGVAERVGRASGAGSVRVDTGHDNAEMLGLLRSMGYARCGEVSYGARGWRAAFEKPLRREAPAGADTNATSHEDRV